MMVGLRSNSWLILVFITITIWIASPSSWLRFVSGASWDRLPAPPPRVFSSSACVIEVTAESLFAQTLKKQREVSGEVEGNCTSASTSTNTVSFILSLGGANPSTSEGISNMYILPWPLSVTRSNQQRWIDAPRIGTQPKARSSLGFIAPQDSSSPLKGYALAYGGAAFEPNGAWLSSLWVQNLETLVWLPIGPSKMYDATNPTGYVCNGKSNYFSNGPFAIPTPEYRTIDDCYFSNPTLIQTDEFQCPWPSNRLGHAMHIVGDYAYVFGGILMETEAVGDLWRLKLDDNVLLALDQQSTSVGGQYVYNVDQLKYLANSSDPTINQERLCPVKWELLTRPDYSASLINEAPSAPFPHNRWIPAVTSSDKWLIISGGFLSIAGTGTSDDVWLLDTQVLRWSQLSFTPLTGPSPAARVYHALFAMQFTNIGSYVLDATVPAIVSCDGQTVPTIVIGGGLNSNSQAPNDMYLLIPDCTSAIFNYSTTTCPALNTTLPLPANSPSITWSFHPVLNSLTPTGLVTVYSNPWVEVDGVVIAFFGKTLTVEGYSKTITAYDFNTKITTALPMPFASSQLASATPTRIIPIARSQHAAFAIDQMMYIYGGMGANQDNNEMWSYHVDFCEWNLIGSINNSSGLWPPFTQADVVVADASGSHIYQYGGGINVPSTTLTNGNLPSMNCTNHFYVFDINTRQWTNLTDQLTSATRWPTNTTSAWLTGGQIINGYLYPRPRCGAEGVILGESGSEELYIFGGILDQTSVAFTSADNALWKLNLTSLQWSLVQASDNTISSTDSSSPSFPTRPASRKFHNMLRLNSDEFFLGFGSNWNTDYIYLSSCWSFNRLNNQWTFMTDFLHQPSGPKPRAFAGITLYQDRSIILNGGSDQTFSIITDTVLYVFNLDTGAWSGLTPAGTLPSQRKAHTLIALNHQHELLMYGDSDGSDNLVHVLHMDDVITAGGGSSTDQLLSNGSLVLHDWLGSIEFSSPSDIPLAFGSSVILSPQPFAFRTLAAAITYTQTTIAAQNVIITVLDTETQSSTETTRSLGDITITHTMSIVGRNNQTAGTRSLLQCDPTAYSCSFIIDTTTSSATSTMVSNPTTAVVSFSDFIFDGGQSSSKGGGMLIQNSKVILTNIDITNCNAQSFGGALAIENSDVTLVGCNLFNNVAGEVGGGIYSLNSNVDISLSTISQNRIAVSSTPLNGQGGGIGMVSTSLTVTDSVFESNQAKYGGGIFASALQSQIIGTFAASIGLRDATFNIHNTNFNGNQALNDGGAIYLSLLEDSLTVPFIESCNFTLNTAGLKFIASIAAQIRTPSPYDGSIDVYHGGAIYLTSSRLLSNNSIFIANGCTGGGGAIYWALTTSDTNVGIDGPIFYPDLSYQNLTSLNCSDIIADQPFFDDPTLISDDYCNLAGYGPTKGSSASSLRFTVNGAAASASLLTSGSLITPTIELMIIDIYGQQVLTDNTTFVSVQPARAFGGSVTVQPTQGLIAFDELLLKIAPNSSQSVQFAATPTLPSLNLDAQLLTLTLVSKPFVLSSGLQLSTNDSFVQVSTCVTSCSFVLPTVYGMHQTHLSMIFDRTRFKHDYDQLVVSYDRGEGLEVFITVTGSQAPNSIDLDIPSSKVSLLLTTGDDALGYVSGYWNFTASCPDGLYLHVDSDRCLEVIESSPIARNIIISFASLALLLLLISMDFLVSYRTAPIFRATSVEFSWITLGLLLLLPIASILFALVPSDSSNAICISRIWFGSLPIIGVLSILFSKSLRIVRIATGGLKSRHDNRTSRLIFAISMIIQLGFCIGFSAVPLSKTELHLHHHVGSLDQLVRQCSLESNFSVWFGIQLGYLSLLGIGAAYIAFQGRSVPSQYNESSHVANALFMLIIVAVIIVPVGILVQDQPDAMVIIQGGGATFIALMWTAVLFAPKFWQVHQAIIQYHKQNADREKAEAQAKATAAAMKIGSPNNGAVQPANDTPDEDQHQLQMAQLSSCLAAAQAGRLQPSPVMAFHIDHRDESGHQRPPEPQPEHHESQFGDVAVVPQYPPQHVSLMLDPQAPLQPRVKEATPRPQLALNLQPSSPTVDTRRLSPNALPPSGGPTPRTGTAPIGVSPGQSSIRMHDQHNHIIYSQPDNEADSNANSISPSAIAANDLRAIRHLHGPAVSSLPLSTVASRDRVGTPVIKLNPLPPLAPPATRRLPPIASPVIIDPNHAAQTMSTFMLTAPPIPTQPKTNQ